MYETKYNLTSSENVYTCNVCGVIFYVIRNNEWVSFKIEISRVQQQNDLFVQLSDKCMCKFTSTESYVFTLPKLTGDYIFHETEEEHL